MFLPGVSAIRSPLPADDFSVIGTKTGSLEEGSGDVDVTLPAGIQEDDLVLVHRCGRSSDSGADDPIVTSGYTNVHVTSFGAFPSLRSDYKLMGATPDTVIRIPTGSLWDVAYAIAVWRNVNTAQVVDNGVSNANGLSSVADIAAHEVLVAGSMRFVVLGIYDHNEVGNIVYPAGYTQQFELAPTDNECTLAVAYKFEPVARSHDPGDFSGFAPIFWRTAHFALRQT